MIVFKRIAFLLILYSSSSYCNNSILAVINDDIISTNQFSKTIKKGLTSEEKVSVLGILINEVLINQKITQLKISVKPKAVQDELIIIASKNGMTLEELSKVPNFQEIINTINRSLSIRALKEIVVNNELKKIEQNSNLLSKTHDELFDNWLNNLRNNSFIHIYEEKLK